MWEIEDLWDEEPKLPPLDKSDMSDYWRAWGRCVNTIPADYEPDKSDITDSKGHL